MLICHTYMQLSDGIYSDFFSGNCLPRLSITIEELFLDKNGKYTLTNLLSILIHYIVDQKCRNGIRVGTSPQNKQKKFVQTMVRKYMIYETGCSLINNLFLFFWTLNILYLVYCCILLSLATWHASLELACLLVHRSGKCLILIQ